MTRYDLHPYLLALAVLSATSAHALGCGDDAVSTASGGHGGSGGGPVSSSGGGTGGALDQEPSAALAILPERLDNVDEGSGLPDDEILRSLAALPDGRLALLFNAPWSYEDLEKGYRVRFVTPEGQSDVVTEPVMTRGQPCFENDSLAHHPSGEVTIALAVSVEDEPTRVELHRFGPDGSLLWSRIQPTGADGCTLAAAGEDAVLLVPSAYAAPWIARVFDAEGDVTDVDGECRVYSHARTTHGGSPPRVWIHSSGGVCSVDVSARQLASLELEDHDELFSADFLSIDVGTDDVVRAVATSQYGLGPAHLWTLPEPTPKRFADEGVLLDDGSIPASVVARLLHTKDDWSSAFTDCPDECRVELLHGTAGGSVDAIALEGWAAVEGMAVAGDEMWVVMRIGEDGLRAGSLVAPPDDDPRWSQQVALRFRGWHSVQATLSP